MGDTLRAPSTQRGANTQVPPVDSTLLRPLLPASSQPRKFEQYANTAVNGAANMRPKESLRPDPGYYQNFAQPQRSRHNLALFLFNTPRQDLFLANNYPIGPPPTAPNSAPPRQAYPSYYLAPRDSVAFPMPPNELPGRLRGDSISLPHPLGQPRYPESDSINFVGSQGMSGMPARNPSRATSIFSLLIQLPESSRNSVSGASSKDTVKTEKKGSASLGRGFSQDFESLGKDSLGNMFGWNQGNKMTPSSSKRGTKEFENQNAFWDQMGNGVTGSIAGVSNDSINAFLANLQTTGSIDFLNMSNEQRRDSIMKFITDQGQRSEPPRLMGTSLREDIFEDQRKSSHGSKGRKSSLSELNHVSPTSSMSSKNSKLRDEPHSPKTSPGRRASQTLDQIGGLQMRGNQQQYLHGQNMSSQRQAHAYYPPQQEAFGYPYQENAQFQAPQMRTTYSQFQASPNVLNQQQYAANAPAGGYVPQMQVTDPNYATVYKGSQFISPGAVEQLNYYPKADPQPTEQTSVDPNKQLVQAQQYARAEDGRPLLGATKVDQLMLVIQAREKGNKTAIKQTTDGSILASPNVDHDKNAVLPLAVDLVGGIEKPQRDNLEDGEPSRKRKRKGKTQECPYCFKQFHQTTHLDVHVRSHIGLKPFECTFCGKRFTQGGNLRTHMRLHTGEKPFVCDICNRNFSRKGNLAAHMLTHNKEKPFDCKLDNCDKSFTQLGNLKSHQNKFHLPTLTKLTQTFASITGDALAQLPEDEKQLLEYFAKLYKNANKGIRGRGKGKRVAKVDAGGNELMSPGSTHTSPEQLSVAMARQNDANARDAQIMNQANSATYAPSAQKYGV